MIRSILQLGNATLREMSSPVEDFQSKALASLIEDLFDTLHEAQKRFGYGRGIAAPQIGVLKRVVSIDMPGFKGPLVNPRIVWKSDKKLEVWDSCFSFSLAFFVLVRRNHSIKVEWFDQEEKRQMINADDKLSELFQHEIDHLDGILAIDRMKDSGKIIMRSEWERIFKKTL